MKIKYFDHAASYPPFKEALDTYCRVSLDYFGNPSSAHYPGFEARALFQKAKKDFSAMCNFPDGRIVLTSGGTEANNTIVNGHMKFTPGARLLIAVDTHPSVWFAVERYNKQCDILPLGNRGRINVHDVKKHIDSKTTLLCMSHVCSETGVVHPVEEISELCARKGVLMLCDGVQALGHLDVDLEKIVCDYYTFSAHKFGGPRGVGGILLRNDRFTPLWVGGKQEWGLRPGTENVAGMAAAAAALNCCLKIRAKEEARLRDLCQRLYNHIENEVDDVILNSDPDNGLPGLLSISVPGLTAQTAVAELNLSGFAVSSGSACHADEAIPSRTIMAMRRKKNEALGTLRISMGVDNTEEDVTALGSVIIEVINSKK